ncbi:MAG: hypothetical protein M3M99_04040 [Actinomycetota bacterium]|nr:hypothetical protein [Actinomycetota bacterium]
MSAATAAVLTAGAARGDARRIGVLFMIGSACFAVASVPGASNLVPELVGVTYFVGSLFFTTAGFEQLRTARGDRRETSAAVIQFAGTLAFNVSTFLGMLDGLDAKLENLLVWSPDAVGSACFLVASAIATLVARADSRVARRSALLNLIGSVAFAASAIAAYTVPDTDQFLNASLDNSMTLIGALFFFRAARLFVVPSSRFRERPAG